MQSELQVTLLSVMMFLAILYSSIQYVIWVSRILKDSSLHLDQIPEQYNPLPNHNGHT